MVHREVDHDVRPPSAGRRSDRDLAPCETNALAHAQKTETRAMV